MAFSKFNFKIRIWLLKCQMGYKNVEEDQIDTPVSSPLVFICHIYKKAVALKLLWNWPQVIWNLCRQDYTKATTFIKNWFHAKKVRKEEKLFIYKGEKLWRIRPDPSKNYSGWSRISYSPLSCAIQLNLHAENNSRAMVDV